MTDDQHPEPEEESDLDKRVNKFLGESDKPKTSEEHLAKLQEIDDQFDKRLVNLEQRAQSTRQKQELKKQAQDERISMSQADSRGLGMGLAAAYTLVGLPLVGAGIGWLIDQGTHSNLWIGILTLAGATIGVAVVLLQLNQNTGKK